MKYINNLSEAEFEFVVTISLALLCYCSYYFIAFSDKTYTIFSRLFKKEISAIHTFCFQKFTGFLFMGLLPVLVISIYLKSPLDYGLSLNMGFETFYWISGIAVVIIPVSFLTAGNPENLKQYPQIRIPYWNRNTFLIDFMGWFMYLLAYEFLFRGVLFFGSIPMMGLLPAIVLNVAIYALAHLPKGAKETFGSIPVGILVCYITYQTGNIWASFLIHLTMAYSNEVFAFLRHPEMHYHKITH